MTVFPKDVRLADRGDEKRLLDLFLFAHSENGIGKVYIPEVEAIIAKACNHEAGFVIAVIDGPERIEAALGLRLDKLWYADPNVAESWFYSDLLFYVHPLHRRSRHAIRLLQFAKWWEERTDPPMAVVLNLLPRDAFEAKDRFFARHGTRVGSAFAMGERSLDALRIVH